ncbi:MAG: hypothetical protein ABL966_00965 [Acidimicrobiales bacterium]
MLTSPSATRVRLTACRSSMAVRDTLEMLPISTAGPASMAGNAPAASTPSSPEITRCATPPGCEASTSVGPVGKKASALIGYGGTWEPSPPV